MQSILLRSVENKLEFNVLKCQVMSFGRMRRPVNYNYQLYGQSIKRSEHIKDLGVTFDRKLNFHEHMELVAKDSFKRLGFVLRNTRDFSSIQALRLVFNALVRSKLESSACVWNPHESKYSILLEKVQKAFLRYLYKRCYGYYPYLYPTKFLLGTLGYNSLEVRRKCDQLTTALKTIHGHMDAPAVHEQLCRLHAPDKCVRFRKHKLFAVPACRTIARARSPVPRSLFSLNALLDQYPECDLFADDWKDILSVCLEYCEKTV